MKGALIVVAGLAAASAVPATAQSVMPGKWRMTSVASQVDMPGMPPQMQAMMKRPRTITYCITPDKAKVGPKSLLAGNRNCHFNRFNVRGNHIDMQMVCNERGGTTTVTGSGGFTPTTFVTDGRAVMGGAHGMSVTSHSEGQRIGECGK